jgi:hypothetical protein
MTFDELKAEMTKLGFKFQENKGEAFRLGLFWRRVETKRPCTCNDKDQIVVEVYDMAGLPGVGPITGEMKRLKLDAQICGEFRIEKQEQWAKISVYGLTTEEFLGARLEIEAALIRAWEALA